MVNLFLFISCIDPLAIENIDLPQGYGSLSLRVADNANGRTIFPTAPSGYAAYNLNFTPTSGGQSLSVDRTNATLATDPVILVAGTYDLTVSAYLDPLKTQLAAQGTANNITITAGVNAFASVQLKALQSTGTGAFNWSVNISASGVTHAVMTITQGSATVESFTLNNTGTTSGNPSLSSGVYNVNFRLEKGATKEEAEWNELLYIFSSLESDFSKTFTDEYFYHTHNNVVFNHNYDGISALQSVLHGDTVTRPSPAPVRTDYVFMDWYTDEALTTLYNFTTPVMNDFTLYAKWGTVSVTVNNITTVYADLAAAFTEIGTRQGNFTVTLFANQTHTANRTINYAGQNITIVGEGAIRTINGSTIGTAVHMFEINNSTASLTLGENITIQGRTTEGSGNVIYNTNGTFKMLADSRITGHTTNAATGAAVRINTINTNSPPQFIMEGGSIDGNNNTTAATNTTASGGVHLNGTFIMSGGSINGNTQGADLISGEASDVYHANTTANSFNISGSANIGALKLNATSTTVGTTVVVGSNWSGNITTLNLRGNFTTIATASGYWIDSTRTIFNGIDPAKVADIGLGEFIGSGNARQAISPYSIGTTGSDLGKLIFDPANAPVTVKNGSTTTLHIDLAAAFTAIGSQAGNFTVTIRVDQTMTANRAISAAGQNITIVGEGTAGERTINHGITSANANMFSISNTAASLTLENITIQGRTTAGEGSAVYMSSGTFKMLPGSRITGHRTINGAVNSATAVHIAGGVFEMSGGSIDGNNNTTAATTTTASGGVIFSGGTFTMTGGSIKGNTHGSDLISGEPSDMYFVHTAVSFTISGGAAIGALKLNAQSATDAPIVTIGSGWSGNIEALNLRGNSSNIATVSTYWNNRAIFTGMTAAQVTAINNRLGQFISSNNERQAINDSHIINNSGVLEAIPTVTVSKDNGTPEPYITLTAAFNAISSQAGNFTITLLKNQTHTANRTISAANQHITIIGEGGMRTINGSSIAAATTMFSINNANASLTLGNNITIQGRTAAGVGAVINNMNGTFKMLTGSKITGHTTHTTDSGSVVAAIIISGASSVFEMSGGSIDGNINTTAAETTTAAAGGVAFTNGTFTMTGGSITNNTQGSDLISGEPSDVYHAVTAADKFNISGNANIGALKLNATSTTAGATITVGSGWSGRIETLNLRGQDMLIASASRLWTSSTRTIFNGIDPAGVARIGLGEFISSNNARQTISDSHIINNSGMLEAILTVTVSKDSGTPVLHQNLDAAFTAIGTQTGNFNITLLRNQIMTAYYQLSANQNITIIGEGGIRTITYGLTNANTHMLILNSTNSSLTLGNNITIQGRTTAGGGSVIYCLSGTFRMLTGSRITGHLMNTSNSTAVHIGSNCFFEMSDGSIDGNSNTAAAASTSTAGGVLVDSGGTFTMTGGSITGNTHAGEASDVYHGLPVNPFSNHDRFIISGGATIGTLKLNATSSGEVANITVGSNWSGSITTLNLRGDNTDITAASGYWTGRTVFTGMTPAQIAAINLGLGQFISSNNARQTISATHVINASGVLVAN